MTVVLFELLAGDGARDSATPTPRNTTAKRATAPSAGPASAAALGDLHFDERLGSFASIIPSAESYDLPGAGYGPKGNRWSDTLVIATQVRVIAGYIVQAAA
jgi:hypothetical protein